MKVFYQFADGTTSIVEVDNELGNQIKDMERYEDKIQKREQRHCNSYDLDGYNIEKDSSLGYVDAELESIWCGKEDEAQMLEKLKTALPLLKPSHRDVIKAIYFDGLSQTEYAAIKGVNQSTVQRTLKAAEKNLKKFFGKICIITLRFVCNLKGLNNTHPFKEMKMNEAFRYGKR